MSAPESMNVPPQVRPGGAARRVEPAPEQPVGRQSPPNCGSCGQAWFGEVAYCPYCGQRATGAPALSAAEVPDHEPLAPPQTEQGRPGIGWKPVVGVAMALVVAVGAVGLLPFTANRPAPRTAGRAPAIRTMGAAGTAVAPAPVVHRAREADPVPSIGPTAVRTPDPAPVPVRGPAPTTTPMTTAAAPPVERPSSGPAPTAAPDPAPPARRSLCSAANEAAGLCNPH